MASVDKNTEQYENSNIGGGEVNWHNHPIIWSWGSTQFMPILLPGISQGNVCMCASGYMHKDLLNSIVHNS